MNTFETASRSKFRFTSVKGGITTEQLWDVPLSSTDGFDLESVAQLVDAELQGLGSNSFVNINPDPKKAARKATVETMLEVVKRVIEVKLAEKAVAEKRVQNKEKRRKLLEALAAQEDAALTKLSRDDILKQLAAIDADQA